SCCNYGLWVNSDPRQHRSKQPSLFTPTPSPSFSVGHWYCTVAEYGSIVPAPGHGPVWGPIKAVLGGIVLVTALLLAAPGLGRHIPLILITAGLAINLTGPDPLATIPSALHELSNVAALLALMPMIRTV